MAVRHNKRDKFEQMPLSGFYQLQRLYLPTMVMRLRPYK